MDDLQNFKRKDTSIGVMVPYKLWEKGSKEGEKYASFILYVFSETPDTNWL